MSSDRSSDVTDVSPLATPKEATSSSFSSKHHHHHHSSTRGHPPPAATATRPNNRWSNNPNSKDADRIDTTVFYDALSSEFTRKLGGGSGGSSSWKHGGGGYTGSSLNQTIDLSSSSYGPKLLRLEAENQKLYERLLRDSKKSSSSSSRGRRGGLDRKSSSLTSSFRLTSSALNRQREQQRIEKENQLILRRLLDVKPSRDLQKEHQLRDYERNFGYLSLKMLPVASASASANSSFAPRTSTAAGGASVTTTHRSSSKRSSAKSSANNSRISSAKSTGMRSAVTFEDDYHHQHGSHHGGGYHDDPHDVLKRTASLSRRPEWSDRW